MDIILSIKPQYADAIFRGEKKWEFRRKIWANFNTMWGKILVYSTAPVSKIIGQFEVFGVEELQNPQEKYIRYFNEGGIKEADYMKYFENCDFGYAIKIEHTILYPKPLELSEFGLKTPPQNFCYINK